MANEKVEEQEGVEIGRVQEAAGRITDWEKEGKLNSLKPENIQELKEILGDKGDEIVEEVLRESLEEARSRYEEGKEVVDKVVAGSSLTAGDEVNKAMKASREVLEAAGVDVGELGSVAEGRLLLKRLTEFWNREKEEVIDKSSLKIVPVIDDLDNRDEGDDVRPMKDEEIEKSRRKLDLGDPNIPEVEAEDLGYGVEFPGRFASNSGGEQGGRDSGESLDERLGWADEVIGGTAAAAAGAAAENLRGRRNRRRNSPPGGGETADGVGGGETESDEEKKERRSGPPKEDAVPRRETKKEPEAPAPAPEPEPEVVGEEVVPEVEPEGDLVYGEVQCGNCDAVRVNDENDCHRCHADNPNLGQTDPELRPVTQDEFNDRYPNMDRVFGDLRINGYRYRDHNEGLADLADRVNGWVNPQQRPARTVDELEKIRAEAQKHRGSAGYEDFVETLDMALGAAKVQAAKENPVVPEIVETLSLDEARDKWMESIWEYIYSGSKMYMPTIKEIKVEFKELGLPDEFWDEAKAFARMMQVAAVPDYFNKRLNYGKVDLKKTYEQLAADVDFKALYVEDGFKDLDISAVLRSTETEGFDRRNISRALQRWMQIGEESLPGNRAIDPLAESYTKDLVLAEVAKGHVERIASDLNISEYECKVAHLLFQVLAEPGYNRRHFLNGVTNFRLQADTFRKLGIWGGSELWWDDDIKGSDPNALPVVLWKTVAQRVDGLEQAMLSGNGVDIILEKIDSGVEGSEGLFNKARKSAVQAINAVNKLQEIGSGTSSGKMQSKLVLDLKATLGNLQAANCIEYQDVQTILYRSARVLFREISVVNPEFTTPDEDNKIKGIRLVGLRDMAQRFIRLAKIDHGMGIFDPITPEQRVEAVRRGQVLQNDGESLLRSLRIEVLGYLKKAKKGYGGSLDENEASLPYLLRALEISMPDSYVDNKKYEKCIQDSMRNGGWFGLY